MILLGKYSGTLPKNLLIALTTAGNVLSLPSLAFLLRLLGQYSLLLPEYVVRDVRLPSPDVAFFAPPLLPNHGPRRSPRGSCRLINPKIRNLFDALLSPESHCLTRILNESRAAAVAKKHNAFLPRWGRRHYKRSARFDGASGVRSVPVRAYSSLRLR